MGYLDQVQANIDPGTPFDLSANLTSQFGAPPPPRPQYDPSQVSVVNNGPPLDIAAKFAPPPPPPVAMPAPQVSAPASAIQPVAMPVQSPAPMHDGPQNVPAPPQPMAFPLVSVRTGGSAASEADLRGPSLREAQVERNAAIAGASQEIAKTSAQNAASAFTSAVDIQNRANAREDAANYSASQRSQDLQDRQNDFDSTVKQLSKTSIDPDRFFASQSTFGKISTLISVTLGGILAARIGGKNQGMELLNEQINRDVDAQKFAYNALHDSASAKQTAFSQAMSKYQNVDAATAAARAAALDSAAAEVMKQSALKEGTDAQNRANAMLAQLQDDKAQQIAHGVKFMPASSGGRVFVDPTTGLSYSEGQARDMAKEYRGYGAEVGKITATGNKELYLEQVKAGLKGQEKADEQSKFISQSERESHIPEQKAQIDDARTKLRDNPITFSERFLTRSFSDSPVVFKALHGKGAAEREQAWNGVYAEARHDLAGANVTPEEAKPIRAAFEGANDTESRMAALKLLEDKLEAKRANIRAGAGDSGRRYDTNKSNIPDGSKGPSGLGAIASFRPTGTR